MRSGGIQRKKGLSESDRFIFRLALQCREWDVYGMMDKMPYSLYQKWVEYHNVEPFGSQFDNWLMAVPTSMFSQVHSKKPIHIKELMYKNKEEKRKEETKQFIHFLDTFEPKGR